MSISDPNGHLVEIRRRRPKIALRKSQLAGTVLPEAAIRKKGNGIDRRPSWVLPYSGGVPIDSEQGLWAYWEPADQEDSPWYSEHIDYELGEALAKWAPKPGRFVEFGCGLGNIASRLACLGYFVEGIDANEHCIFQARERVKETVPNVQFKLANILQLSAKDFEHKFDYAFDRGCFHCFREVSLQRKFAQILAAIHKSGGILFLKTFSVLEPSGWGPTRHSAESIYRIFGEYYKEVENLQTSFEATLSHQPKALFSVLRRR